MVQILFSKLKFKATTLAILAFVVFSSQSVYGMKEDGDKHFPIWTEIQKKFDEQNYCRARALLKQLVEKKDSQAMLVMGKLCFEGQGGLQNYDDGLAYYEQAANLGNLDAIYELSCLYRKGIGVRKDYKKARRILEKFISEKHVGILNSLAEIYFNGKGVKKNLTTRHFSRR